MPVVTIYRVSHFSFADEGEHSGYSYHRSHEAAEKEVMDCAGIAEAHISATESFEVSEKGIMEALERFARHSAEGGTSNL